MCASRLANGLADYGYQVSVCTGAARVASCTCSKSSVQVERFRAVGLGRLFDPYRGEIEEYRRRLVEIRADVNIFVCWENWFLDNALPVFDDIPGKKVIASHGTSALWRPPGLRGILRRLAYLPHLSRYRLGLGKTDALVTLTSLMQRERFYDNILVKKYPRVRTVTIPNGYELNSRGTLGLFRKKYSLEDKSIALCVSNYSWSKNQLTLLDLFREARLSDWVLVLIGSSTNDYYEKVKRKARNCSPKAPNILVLSGVNEDIPSAYEDADLFVTTSLTEAQPLMLLDAMSFGLPFIAYDVGCIKEMPGGIAVEDRRQFLETLKRLALSSEERARLGELGRRSASARYCWDEGRIGYARLMSTLAEQVS